MKEWREYKKNRVRKTDWSKRGQKAEVLLQVTMCESENSSVDLSAS